MSIKNTMGIGLVFILSIACAQQEKTFDGKVNIFGDLDNYPEGYVVLSQYKENTTEVLDTLILGPKGQFEYTLDVQGPAFYDLNLMNEKIIRLALYDEDVKIKYDFKKDDRLSITGSSDTDQLKKIDLLAADYQEEINQLNSEYYEAMNAKDQAKIKQIQERAMGLENTHGNKVKAVINDMDGSFSALAAIGMLNPKSDFQFLDSLIIGLDEKYPNTKNIVSVKQQLDEMRALSIGQPAPEISLPNPGGQTINLSDLRGNYVLIDFWAAWCKPCREENPNVVRLYEKYHAKGFEVYGVSLDRTREAWLRGIEEDGLVWTQVSDLQYFNSAAADTYQINAIPATYLIDPDGNIIAKDLRGSRLEDKLKELLD